MRWQPFPWLLLVMLCGCSGAASSEMETPGPRTWEAELPIGEKTLWVELAETGRPAEDGSGLDVNIYQERGDPVPIQHFEDVLYCSGRETELIVEDVDFDGDLDFHFTVSAGAWDNCFSSYYIWDEETTAFQRDPYGFNELCNVELYPEKRVLRSYERYNIAAHETSFYQIEDGGLVCVRRLKVDYPIVMENGREGLEATVEDRRDGMLTVVYHKLVDPAEQPSGGEIDPGFSRWYDLDDFGA